MPSEQHVSTVCIKRCLTKEEGRDQCKTEIHYTIYLMHNIPQLWWGGINDGGILGFMSCGVVCSKGLEEHTASNTFEVTELVQVTVEVLGGRKFFLHRSDHGKVSAIP